MYQEIVIYLFCPVKRQMLLNYFQRDQDTPINKNRIKKAIHGDQGPRSCDKLQRRGFGEDRHSSVFFFRLSKIFLSFLEQKGDIVISR